MTRWLVSLLIILALGSGALAGTPLSSGEKECAMNSVMKCCKRQAAGRATPVEITKANLCRALVCEQSGSTASIVQLPQLSTLIVAALYFNTLKLSPAKQTKVSRTNSEKFVFSPCKNPLFLQHQTFRI